MNLLYSKKKKTNELTSDADKFLLDLVDKNIIQKVEEAVKATMQQQKKQSVHECFFWTCCASDTGGTKTFKGRNN